MKSTSKYPQQLNVRHNLTLISIGVIAYVFADIMHEVIGHGFTSLILGNKITLISSVYFRSTPHSFIADAFGPITNLFTGILIWFVLETISIKNFYLKLLLLIAMAFNFFWFSWLCIYGGITYTDDFAFNVSTETMLLVWRILLILIGIFSYRVAFFCTAKIASQLPRNFSVKLLRQLFSIPYLSACIAALVAVSFYTPVSFDSYYEAITFPMFLPIIFIPAQLRKTTSFENNTDTTFLKKQQTIIIITGLLFFIAFCLTSGKGIKP